LPDFVDISEREIFQTSWQVMFLIDSACLFVGLNTLLRGWRAASFAVLFLGEFVVLNFAPTSYATSGLLLEFLVKALPLFRRLAYELRQFRGELSTGTGMFLLLAG